MEQNLFHFLLLFSSTFVLPHIIPLNLCIQSPSHLPLLCYWKYLIQQHSNPEINNSVISCPKLKLVCKTVIKCQTSFPQQGDCSVSTELICMCVCVIYVAYVCIGFSSQDLPSQP